MVNRVFSLPSWIHAKIISWNLRSRKKKRRKGGGKEKKKKSIPSEGTHFLFHLWTSFSFQFLLSPYFLSRVEIHFNPFLTFYYIYIYFYITFRSNFSNRIVFDRKKKSLIDPLNDVNKKKKEKDKSTIAKNLLSRYFSILSNNSLSLSPSFLHAFRLCEANIYRAVSPVPRATKS